MIYIKYKNLLTIVDDAHSTGVIGKCGIGSSELFDCEIDIDIVLSKIKKVKDNLGI